MYNLLLTIYVHILGEKHSLYLNLGERVQRNHYKQQHFLMRKVVLLPFESLRCLVKNYEYAEAPKKKKYLNKI